MHRARTLSAAAAVCGAALAVATPELARRSSRECEERIVSLSPSLSYGRRPAVLDDWERMDDGRFVGTLEGQQGTS